MPCVRITDYPRFAWRGLLIDPARHFIPVAGVEQYLDTMALQGRPDQCAQAVRR